MGASTYKKVSNSHIHDDIAFSILSKLPLKSLKRFTCVKKSWFLLFQNPTFMNMFRNDFFISKHDEDDISTCLLFKERTVNFEYHDALYTHSGQKFEDKVRLDWPPPFKLDDSFIEILGSTSVKGVLCIYQKIGNETTTVLWNPATGEFKIIPPSLQPYDNIECNSCPVAFGYDIGRDDYKVIRNA
jgi:molecular chaperone HtpG